MYGWHHHTVELADKPPSLREAVLWIAKKGGFQGRKADGHPGAEVLWHGLQKLDVAVEMYLIFRPLERGALRSEFPPWYLRSDEAEEDTG